MYHRYLPTANGQYRRVSVPERRTNAPPKAPRPEPERPPVAVPQPEQSPILPPSSEGQSSSAQEAPSILPPPPTEQGSPTQEAPPILPPPPTEQGSPTQEMPKKAGRERKNPERKEIPFLERLFPGLDSGDLLLLFVLLLLLSEGNEEASPTILTLALSLLMQ